MDIELLYSIGGFVVFSLIIYFIFRDKKVIHIQTKEEKKRGDSKWLSSRVTRGT